MKEKTFFKINTQKEFDEVYRDFFEGVSYNFLNKKFQNGENFLCIEVDGSVTLRESPPTGFDLIANPYSKSSRLDESIKSENSESSGLLKESKIKIQKADSRRERIDYMIKMVGLEVDPNKVTKLLQIFDLDFQEEEHVSFKKVFDLRNDAS